VKRGTSSVVTAGIPFCGEAGFADVWSCKFQLRVELGSLMVSSEF
jgi:hypothetical protein